MCKMRFHTELPEKKVLFLRHIPAILNIRKCVTLKIIHSDILMSDESYFTEFHLPATFLSLKIDPISYNRNIEASTSKYRC